MTELCQSCRKEPVEVAEPCDNADAPYLVCRKCHARLLSRSLRPAEWFNLAGTYGWWQYLLHDDFYEDDGTASQPADDVEAAELHPCPTLPQVSNDCDRLLDYTTTRWRIEDQLAAAWCQLPATDVRRVVAGRFSNAPNSGARSACLDVLAIALKSSACDFVAEVWQKNKDRVDISSLFRATAACMPIDQGFQLASNLVEELDGRERRHAMVALSYFQSPRALQWIERHAAEPTTEDWGNLAAASCLSWSEVLSWLTRGRPFSLIAIDALRAIADPKTPLLRAMSPALLTPPTADDFMRAIAAYEVQDPVPRVRQRIETLKAAMHKLCTEPLSKSH